MTDRHTHRPTDKRKGKNNMSPDPCRGGDIILKRRLLNRKNVTVMDSLEIIATCGLKID